MPRDTKEMKYNYNKHMYESSIEHLNEKLGLDFVEKEGSLTKAKDKMYQISRTIYNYIYSHTHYKHHMEYYLAITEEFRPIIQDVLEEQARYEFEMSAEFLAFQSGVNVINGVQIPLSRFRGIVRIAPEAENILRNSRLLYQGKRFFTKNGFDYEGEGY